MTSLPVSLFSVHVMSPFEGFWEFESTAICSRPRKQEGGLASLRVHAHACVRARGKQSRAVCVYSASPSICLPAHLPVSRSPRRPSGLRGDAAPLTWLRASRLHGRPGNRIDFLSRMFDSSDKALDDPMTQSHQIKGLHGYSGQVQVGSHAGLRTLQPLTCGLKPLVYGRG